MTRTHVCAVCQSGRTCFPVLSSHSRLALLWPILIFPPSISCLQCGSEPRLGDALGAGHVLPPPFCSGTPWDERGGTQGSRRAVLLAPGWCRGCSWSSHETGQAVCVCVSLLAGAGIQGSCLVLHHRNLFTILTLFCCCFLCTKKSLVMFPVLSFTLEAAGCFFSSLQR